MFAVIYRAFIKPGQEESYRNYWKQVSTFFVKKRGSLGCTLHKTPEGMWVAYSKWPNKATRDSSWSNEINATFPKEIHQAIEGLRGCFAEQLPEICMEIQDEIK